jgi:hypothetical protein
MDLRPKRSASLARRMERPKIASNRQRLDVQPSMRHRANADRLVAALTAFVHLPRATPKEPDQQYGLCIGVIASVTSEGFLPRELLGLRLPGPLGPHRQGIVAIHIDELDAISAS